MEGILGDKRYEVMSLSELEARASMVESAFKAFNKIRKKYGV